MRHIYSFLLVLLFSIQFGFAQSAEHATVYLTRLGLQGAAVDMHIFHGGEYLGAIRGSDVIKVDVPTGEQLFQGIFSMGPLVSNLEINAEAGKEYYIAGKADGVMTAVGLHNVTHDSKNLKRVKRKVLKGDLVTVSSFEKDEYENKFSDHLPEKEIRLANKIDIASAQEAAIEAAKFTSPEDMVTVHFAHVGTVADYIELPVFHNTNYIGSIKGNQTVTYKAEPGNLTFTGVYTEVNFASTVNVEADPGKTYYLQADLNGGAYKMEATPEGKLTHYFLTNVTGESGKQSQIDKLVKKKRSVDFSDAQKKDLERTYGELVQTTMQGPTTTNYIADATAGPSTTGATSYIPATNTSTSSTANSTSEFGLNKRELALREILEKKDNSSDSSEVSEGTETYSVIEEEGKVEKVRHSEDNTEAGLKYRRSSLYTLMINDTDRQHFGVIRDAFGNFELSEKFNDHNIGPYLIDAEGGEKDQSDVITAYLNENGVGRDLVAKWFNRNEKGEFNMDLVAARGSYNASDLDVMIANDSKRGAALLADAGEELIGNTFIIVNDYKYVNKEEIASKASGVLSFVSDVASIAGYDEVALVADATNLGASVMGKGYVVKTTSYLYRLVWNEDVAGQFYSNLWMDSRNYDPAKKEAFESSDLFKLKLVGSESAWADLQSTAFTKKSDQDLIRIATVKATNKGISKLQRKFEEFRTKSPLLSGDPITAKIGLKEGLEKGDKFEVLEQVIDKDGRTSYKRVGKIKVDHNHIWDNTFLSEETDETTVSEEEFTRFKGKEGKYYSGMLIRQIN